MNKAGELVTLEKPSDAELDRHLFMLVSSLLHEIQHIATDIFLNPQRHDSFQPADCDASGCKSPTPNSSLPQKRGTPVHIGTCTVNGQEAGDSGFELEDTIFGARIAHVDRGLMSFEVNVSPVALDLFISMKNRKFLLTSDMLNLEQMAGLVAQARVEVTPKTSPPTFEVRLFRLSDGCVSRLLRCLEAGRRVAVL